MSSQLQDIVNARTGGYSAASELENAEKVAQMYADAMNAQYAAGIQNLSDQKARLGAEYDPYRAAANAQYERNVRTNNEQMANLGLNRSGTNLTNQIKLSTERQRNLAEVDSNQAKAAQDLQAQINEYIAQRDSAIATHRANTYQSAYNNISDYQRSSALAEQQFGYDQKLAELDYAHDKEMAALNHEYTIAEMNNDYAKKAQLEREMAALDYSYSIQKMERQAQLDTESYAQRAATDWNYYQQQASLDNQYAQSLYDSKAATDWNYYQQQAAIDNQYAQSLYNAKAATDWNYTQKEAALKASTVDPTDTYLAKMSDEEITASLELMDKQGNYDGIGTFLDDLVNARRLSTAQADAYYGSYMLKKSGEFYNNRQLSNNYESYYKYAYGDK